LTIATLQLGVGCLYGLFLWAAPDARKLPTTTKDDIIACIPVAFCSAAAHSFSVFGACLSLSLARAHTHTFLVFGVPILSQIKPTRVRRVYLCNDWGEKDGVFCAGVGAYAFVLRVLQSCILASICIERCYPAG